VSLATYSTPESRCLRCGKKFAAATECSRTDGPTPGSLLVCFHCGAVTVYDDDLRIRPFTEREAAELAADAELIAHLASIVRVVHIVKHARN